MNLQEYRRNIDGVIDVMTDLYSFSNEEQVINQGKRIHEAIKKIKNDDFKVVVIGDFSRGKSTFINAMLGCKLLPAKKKASTALITILKYADEPSAKLIKVGNKEESISLEALFELKAPAQQELNTPEGKAQEKRIRDLLRAEVFYPLSLCKNKVSLVDTPGLNDTVTYRSELTYNFLENSDAAILLLSCTQILTADEISYIKNKLIGNNIRDIFFVATRKDELGGNLDEEKRVEEFIVSTLKEEIPSVKTKDRVFLVSGQQALYYRLNEDKVPLKPSTIAKLPSTLEETGIVNLESQLQNFLSNEKGNVKLKKYALFSYDCISELSKILENKRNVLLADHQVILDKLKILEPKFTTAKKDTDRIIDEFEAKARLKGTDIKWELKRIKEAAIPSINQTIKEISEDILSGEHVEAILQRYISQSNDELRKCLHKVQGTEIEAIKVEYVNKLMKVWGKLDEEYCNTLTSSSNTSLVPQNKQSVNTNCTIYVDDVLTSKEKETLGAFIVSGGIGLALAGAPLLPVIALGAVVARFLGVFNTESKHSKFCKEAKRIFYEYYDTLEANVTEQFKEYIHQETEAIRGVFQGRIEEMEHQIQVALEEKENSQQEVERKIDLLCEKGKRLQSIGSRLDKIVKELNLCN